MKKICLLLFVLVIAVSAIELPLLKPIDVAGKQAVYFDLKKCWCNDETHNQPVYSGDLYSADSLRIAINRYFRESERPFYLTLDNLYDVCADSVEAVRIWEMIR